MLITYKILCQSDIFVITGGAHRQMSVEARSFLLDENIFLCAVFFTWPHFDERHGPLVFVCDSFNKLSAVRPSRLNF
jgi:hypothetical protein